MNLGWNEIRERAAKFSKEWNSFLIYTINILQDCLLSKKKGENDKKQF